MEVVSMAKILILFNHRLTEDQGLDATDLLGVREFVFPPVKVSLLWQSIPPEVLDLKPVLSPVFEWIDSKGAENDYLLVQGEFGATFLVVEYAMKRGLIPVYSTTERRAVEKREMDGTVRTVHEFQHVRFREYGTRYHFE